METRRLFGKVQEFKLFWRELVKFNLNFVFFVTRSILMSMPEAFTTSVRKVLLGLRRLPVKEGKFNLHENNLLGYSFSIYHSKREYASSRRLRRNS